MKRNMLFAFIVLSMMFIATSIAYSHSDSHAHEKTLYEYSEYNCYYGNYMYRRDWYSISVDIHYHDDDHYEPGNGYWYSNEVYLGNRCYL